MLYEASNEMYHWQVIFAAPLVLEILSRCQKSYVVNVRIPRLGMSTPP